jgi:hypothetical protein
VALVATGLLECGLPDPERPALTFSSNGKGLPANRERIDARFQAANPIAKERNRLFIHRRDHDRGHLPGDVTTVEKNGRSDHRRNQYGVGNAEVSCCGQAMTFISASLVPG